jgi:hypothetical protein
MGKNKQLENLTSHPGMPVFQLQRFYGGEVNGNVLPTVIRDVFFSHGMVFTEYSIELDYNIRFPAANPSKNPQINYVILSRKIQDQKDVTSRPLSLKDCVNKFYGNLVMKSQHDNIERNESYINIKTYLQFKLL